MTYSMGIVGITVGHCIAQWPTPPNLALCFHYIIAEKVKSMHYAFYVQLLENKLNLNARKKILKKREALVKACHFVKSRHFLALSALGILI